MLVDLCGAKSVAGFQDMQHMLWILGYLSRDS